MRPLTARVDCQQCRQSHVDRPVHHQAEGALIVVLAHIGERAGEIRVDHVRHGDQEVIGQVHGAHGSIVNAAHGLHNETLRPGVVSDRTSAGGVIHDAVPVSRQKDLVAAVGMPLPSRTKSTSRAR
jgi:hypothetical protein